MIEAMFNQNNVKIMKSTKQIFKEISVLALLFYLSHDTITAQVITRVLTEDDQIGNYIPWYNPDDIAPTFKAPIVNVEAILDQDSLDGRHNPRISVKQEVNISGKDGILIKKSNFSLWKFALESEGAKSLSIRFKDTHLPEKAIMFIYNKDTRFIVGPIHSDNFRNGSFRSDYINGDRVEISIFLPSLVDTVGLRINFYDYGFIPLNSLTNLFASSLECNVNVACDEGNGWECQINSVCVVYDDEGRPCSGSLVNNACCDLSQYILSANHCLSGNVDDFLFRFNWQTPDCENGESAPTEWVTYLGAETIASWGSTDFILFEMSQRIRSEDRISFAGWDRRNIIPAEVTMIHHPRGDVKKITFNENPVLENNTITSIDGLIILAPQHSLRVTLNQTGGNDFGILQRGSSGGPWFNNERRIIGHTSLGQTPSSCNLERDALAGRFFNSWTGGGTPNSRLQNWLGNSTNPNTMDCMDHPFVDGLNFLCETPANFTLINSIMPCVKNINWEVEPPHLFNSPATGSGQSANLVRNLNANGPANIEFVLSSEDCEDAVVEHSFWVGKPIVTTSIEYPIICLNQFEEMVILESPGATSYNLQSLSPNVWISTNTPIPNMPFTIIGNQLGYHQLLLTVTNECGSSSSKIYVDVVRCGGGFGLKKPSEASLADEIKIDLFPNPAKNTINISYSTTINNNTGANIAIFSSEGRLVRTVASNGGTLLIDLADLPSGMYIIKIEINGNLFHEKIIKI